MTTLEESRLDGIRDLDFNFHNSKTNRFTHGLHPYPAKYIPQIPNALISRLTDPGDTVVDIFCGSGTTLVESMLLNRRAVGIDANPLACLISKTKTTRITPEDSTLLLTLSKRAEGMAQAISGAGKTLFAHEGPFMSQAERPIHNAIEFWFDPFVVEELAEIRDWCYQLPNIEMRQISLVALSSIIVTVSKQDSDTRYVRRDKGIMPGATFLKFARALKASVAAVQTFSDAVDPEITCQVFQSSILDCPETGMFDLMVCSPPYPNAFSYHLYHMTRMVWLGMDQPKFKAEEIGSHRKYSSKGPNGATVETFKNEMSTILEWLSHKLKPKGYACFVIGDSTLKGELIRNADLVAEAGLKHGLSEVERIPRQLQSTRKAFNPAIGKIREENILILQNRP